MIAKIAPDDALILPRHANPARSNARERQRILRKTTISNSPDNPVNATARRLGDSEHDEERDRRRRDEIVGRCQVAAGNTDQPSRDERGEAAEYCHGDVVAD